MVAGNVSKDSWSRCEAPSMLYDTIRNPKAPYQPPKISSSSISKDTIESTQQRLNREMLDRFQNKGLELPHESYVAVIQIGKYMFLAVMLPVYLCIYGIPRWFLVAALPQLYSGVANQFVNVGRFISELSKRVSDLMKGMLEQLIGDALRMSKDRAKNFLKHLFLKLSHFSGNISKSVEELSERIKKIRNGIALGSVNLYVKAEKNAHLANQWIAEQALIYGKRIYSKSLHAFNEFDRTALTPMLKIVVYPLKLISKAGNNLILNVKKIKNQIQDVVDPLISSLKETIKMRMEKSKRTLEKLIQPVNNWILEKIEVLERQFSKFKKAVVEPFIETTNAIKAKIEIPLLAMAGVAKKAFSVFPSLKRSLKLASRLTPKKTKDKYKKTFNQWKNSTRQLLLGVAKGIKEIFLFGIKLISKTGAFLIWFGQSVARLIRMIFSQLKTLPRKIKKYAFTFFKGAAFLFARVAFAGQIVIALMWIACVHAFHLAHQMSNPVPNKTPKGF